MTYTEVDSVEGEAGDFKVTLIKKPRYVIEDKCTGCTTCVQQLLFSRLLHVCPETGDFDQRP
ncbi:hypothetical protein JCM15765_26620 [Paradesulfitobacterium aromaticivorans]